MDINKTEGELEKVYRVYLISALWCILPIHSVAYLADILDCSWLGVRLWQEELSEPYSEPF